MERLNDGDTFEIQGQRIRLKGIDAPEISQTCKNKQGHGYACGDLSANYLRLLVRKQTVRCESQDKDEYGRLIAYCVVGDLDLNKQMVSSGWAVAYHRFDQRYVADEQLARAAKRGIWRGQFVRPASYRAAEWKMAQRVAGQDRKKCPIKGNINAKGARIYHTPWGSKNYARTRINENRGERWFCSEAEALKAGWRAPIR